MIKFVWNEPGEPFLESQEIRKAVFVKEQGYTLEEEFDEWDNTVPHLVLFEEDIPVATGRLILLEDGTAKLGRIAVLKEFRGLHYGAKIVEELLNRAKLEGAKRAYVSAQEYAIPFYNQFGLKEYGEIYLDGRIPHKDMELYF